MLFSLRTTASRYVFLTIFYTCVLLFLIVQNDQLNKVNVASFPADNERSISSEASQIIKNVKEKTLALVWTDYYEFKGDQILEKFIFPARKWDKDCCTGSVELTTDKSLLENATSVVFFAYFGTLDKKTLPKIRPTGQLWILFLKESPTYTPGLSSSKNLFNWTMSYRKDSDIWSPYGEIVKINPPKSPDQPIKMPGDIPLNEWIHNKTKLVAWVNSNCKTKSRRELYKTALEAEGPNVIDVFGGCHGAKKICPRRKDSCNHTKFWHELAQKYVFYFAAENSLCVDYITEKFWRALDIGIIPVVYGGADYEGVAPPNSYIDVRDFESVEKLVDYLKKVAGDELLHGKYFEWRRTYMVQSTECWKGWCELCRRTGMYKVNSGGIGAHSDLSTWWNKWPKKDNNSILTRKQACFEGPLIVTEEK